MWNPSASEHAARLEAEGASGAERVELEGPGLHGGLRSRLVAWRRPGPLAFARDGREYVLSRLVPSGERRSTELRGDGFVLRTAEHLFAALGALGQHEGVCLAVEGEECPLLDGGAAEYLRVLRTLFVEPRGTRPPPPLRVESAGEVRVGKSVYRFAPRPASGASTRVSVTVDFDDPRLAREAQWDGDLADFALRIAPARTFGFAHELGELAARGLASHVDRESVVLVTPTEILSAGAPFFADEPARHKLLDLVGDLFVWGGPPSGTVHAERPGHAATHAAVAEALARGILAR